MQPWRLSLRQRCQAGARQMKMVRHTASSYLEAVTWSCHNPWLGRMDESRLAQFLHIFSYLATTKTRNTGLGKQWCRQGP